MSFMKSYKCLDAICRDMNGIGVTGYIEDMERRANGAYIVPNWEADYKKLKHYRWLRNRIAHDVGAEEQDLCIDEDEKWLNDFYKRIIQCDDPLAYYEKAKNKKTSTGVHKKSSPLKYFLILLAVFSIFLLFWQLL